MTELKTLWRSPEGEDNALALRAGYPAAFEAIAELDALGHRILQRASEAKIVDDIDRLVGLSILRRAVTLFVGVRHLLEASAVESAKLPLRALFETLLALRYLVHGGRCSVDLFTASDPKKREARARYFVVAAERALIYRRQGLLDGKWGAERISGRPRKDLNKEVTAEIARLQRDYLTQTRRYGPYRFQVTGDKKKRYYDDREWYSFGFRSGKVNSVRALAARFGWTSEYEHLYSAFSGVMHPRGISHDGKVSVDGFEIFHPYIADAFELIVTWLCNWQLLILAVAIKAYSPESLPDAQTVQKKVSQLISRLEAGVPDGLI